MNTMWFPCGHNMVTTWTPHGFYVHTMRGWKPQSNHRMVVTMESPWDGGKNVWQPWEGGNQGRVETTKGW